jgi:hypothetical protein
MSQAAASASQKLEKLFQSLNPDEQRVISELVRAALIQAAERFEGTAVAAVPGAMEAYAIPEYVAGLTGQNAPSLVKSMHFPGSLAAHGIPGCNASALVAIRAQFGKEASS